MKRLSLLLISVMIGCGNVDEVRVPVTITCYDRKGNITTKMQHVTKSIEFVKYPGQKTTSKYCVIEIED